MRPVGIGLDSSSLCYLDCEKKKNKMQIGKAVFKPGLFSYFKTEMFIRLVLSLNIWGIS